MGPATGRAELVRAAREVLAARVAEVATQMARHTGVPLERLRADGGVSASAALMQAQADLTGVPVDVSAEPEATAMGAAALALRALGVWADDAEVTRRVTTARTFEPQIEADERQARAARFARAVALVGAFE
jgi:glycerol kinase